MVGVVFFLNGERTDLSPAEVDPTWTLNDYIRLKTRFKGTKISCGEGGCGACVVLLSKPDPVLDNVVHHGPANSCLLPLAALDGSSVTTTEGLGSSQQGFHPIQQRIASVNGSQCGFCTPGFVMSMYSTLKECGVEGSKSNLTMSEIEQRFDGQLCRCTGYRAILDATKTFAKDSNIEDHVCHSTLAEYHPDKDPAFPEVLKSWKSQAATFQGSNLTWIRVVDLTHLFEQIAKVDGPVKLVNGNTSVGIYKTGDPKVFIDISKIPELLITERNDEGIAVGTSRTISFFVKQLQQAVVQLPANKTKGFEKVIPHLLRIASHNVRNIGSIGGNIMLAKEKGFASDLVTVLLTLGARVNILSASSKDTISLYEFIHEKKLEKGQILAAVLLPFSHEQDHFMTFKVSQRPQNSHAYINMGARVAVENGHITSSTIVYGALVSHAVRALKTEKFLEGKPVNRSTLKEAISLLKQEVPVTTHQKKDFCANLVPSLFFKFFISLINDSKENELSAGVKFVRQASVAKQDVAMKSEDDPISRPIPKLSSNIQAAGEAVYTDDVPTPGNTRYGAFVAAPFAKGKITHLETSDAQSLPGFVAFISAKDIPAGQNNSSVLNGDALAEPLFAYESVKFFGQPIGIVVADTPKHAFEAAKAIKVQYEAETPLLTIDDAIKANSILDLSGWPLQNATVGNVEEGFKTSEKVITGTIHSNSQQHFYMEPQSALAIPDENGGIKVYSSNQYPQGAQRAVSRVLGIPMHKVEVIMRRAGGGFGGKLTHFARIAGAAALAARKLNVPVKLTLDRATDMSIVGGRHHTQTNYKVGVDNNGRIKALEADIGMNGGAFADISGFCSLSVIKSLDQVYHVENVKTKATVYLTNISSKTAMRGPGEIQGSFIMESIIEHVAAELKKSPQEIRELNMYPPQDENNLMCTPSKDPLSHYTMPRIWKELKESSNFQQKVSEVTAFNEKNRYRKQGIAMTPVKYHVSIPTSPVLLHIYEDGSVNITTHCSEIGQGSDTKIIAAASLAFSKLDVEGGVPLSSFRIMDTSTNYIPNMSMTGGSTTSEGACKGVMEAAKTLIARLQPTLELLKEGAINEESKKVKSEGDAGDQSNRTETNPKKISWTDLIRKASDSKVHLSVAHQEAGVLGYHNYGAAVSVVEIDVLTGEVEILSTDILYDCGKSLNPAIDVGQVEGGFMMGVGFYLYEDVIVDEHGELFSDNTWEYKIPAAGNVPLKFNVSFLKDCPFEKGVLSSKASGEPPLVLSTSVFAAVRYAIAAARKDRGLSPVFTMDSPATLDKISLLCGGLDDN